ncbi:diguanylate cyclase (GGDEF)-like protein [Paraburkholderia sp. BL23I1N1]|uniref:bifunctional diguanylate cyclase/phosphodiesterase n=1 Tax=Paraburkholderia sp. BL23I1N1 TaxID=1938802 RepID=UPI000E725CA9|nr:EAL domain-containing protein [Paraburkholderia sp. BL23I1N1]RKE23888.1 diguanylate cyclase (GGDEF)-like protein [Paraburkholderia sp. BL23I1N1]
MSISKTPNRLGCLVDVLKSCADRSFTFPLVAVVLSATIWAATVQRIDHEGEQARAADVATNSQLASAFAAHIAKTVHDADVVVQWVKYEYERSPATFALADYKRRGLVSADTALQVTIVDATGKVLQTTTPDARAVNLSDRLHFRVHEQGDIGLYISQPVLGRVSSHWTLQFTRRLNHPDGSFAGVVVVSEDPDFLTDGFYNLDGLGLHGMLAVLSDNGYLLSRLAGGEPTSPKGPPASAFSAMTGAKGKIVKDPVDGVERFVSYHHLTEYHVSILAGVSADDALAPFRQARLLYCALASFLSLSLLAAAAWQVAVTRRFRRLAETDSLTGLPNRHLMLQTIRRRIRGEAPERVGLLYIDLDNFKGINDTLGHKVGDDLLRNVAFRLEECAAPGDVLARIGGDEFAYLISDEQPLARAELIAQDIVRVFRRVFVMRGEDYTINVSIGIVLHKQPHDNEFGLLTKADLAMYAAKNRGRQGEESRYHVYTPELSSRAMTLLEQRQTLQYAIMNREFFVLYQPIVTLDGMLHGIEALARWKHPERGVLLPEQFIPLAESTGLIVQLGEFVLRQACHDFQAWQESTDSRLHLSVNVSPVQLSAGGLVHSVKECLNDNLMDPDVLQLEITETAVLSDNSRLKSRIQDIRRLGVKVVLDDFGTGHSSLSNLVSQTVDGIKIDKRFVEEALHQPVAAALIESLVQLTRNVGLSLVVEGVERKEQAEWLARFSNILVQGFHFSRPAPIEELAAMLRAG